MYRYVFVKAVHMNEMIIQSDIFMTLLTTKCCRNLGMYWEI
jgi:hypothetical protein